MQAPLEPRREYCQAPSEEDPEKLCPNKLPAHRRKYCSDECRDRAKAAREELARERLRALGRMYTRRHRAALPTMFGFCE